jgi:hypothetical protein
MAPSRHYRWSHRHRLVDDDVVDSWFSLIIVLLLSEVLSYCVAVFVPGRRARISDPAHC